MPGFPTIIRDGRTGRDPEKVTREGGEILAEFDADAPIEEGQIIEVEGVGRVLAIGVETEFGPASFTQTVHVGNV